MVDSWSTSSGSVTFYRNDFSTLGRCTTTFRHVFKFTMPWKAISPHEKRVMNDIQDGEASSVANRSLEHVEPVLPMRKIAFWIERTLFSTYLFSFPLRVRNNRVSLSYLRTRKNWNLRKLVFTNQGKLQFMKTSRFTVTSRHSWKVIVTVKSSHHKLRSTNDWWQAELKLFSYTMNTFQIKQVGVWHDGLATISSQAVQMEKMMTVWRCY